MYAGTAVLVYAQGSGTVEGVDSKGGLSRSKARATPG